MIKKLIPIVFALALIPVWAGCGGFPDNAVAEVNGKVITREDLDFRMDKLRATYGELPATDSEEYKELERQTVEIMVNEEIIAFEAEEMDIHVTDDEVEEEIEARQEAVGGKEIYEQQLEVAGTTLAREMEQMRKDLLFRKVNAEVVKDAPRVTEEQALAYYNENAEQFNVPEEMREVRHILVATEAEANDVLARLNAGEDFSALAAELSLDESNASLGGQLGEHGTVSNQFVPEFSAAMAALPVGQYSDPVQTSFGFHIIEVTAIIPPGMRPFEEVKESLIQQMQVLEADWNFFFAWLEEVREKYEITYADEFKPLEDETDTTGTGTSTTGTTGATDTAAAE